MEAAMNYFTIDKALYEKKQRAQQRLVEIALLVEQGKGRSAEAVLLSEEALRDLKVIHILEEKLLHMGPAFPQHS
jgi:hypothetical protein